MVLRSPYGGHRLRNCLRWLHYCPINGISWISQTRKLASSWRVIQQMLIAGNFFTISTSRVLLKCWHQQMELLFGLAIFRATKNSYRKIHTEAFGCWCRELRIVGLGLWIVAWRDFPRVSSRITGGCSTSYVDALLHVLLCIILGLGLHRTSYVDIKAAEEAWHIMPKSPGPLIRSVKENIFSRFIPTRGWVRVQKGVVLVKTNIHFLVGTDRIDTA